jgi:hypothetical protein
MCAMYEPTDTAIMVGVSAVTAKDAVKRKTAACVSITLNIIL